MLATRLRNVTVLLLLAVLQGCGGAPAGSSAAIEGSGSIEGSGAAKGFSNIGAISDIGESGQITVNGETLSIRDAALDIEGRSVTATALSVGQVVTVRGVAAQSGAAAKPKSASVDIALAGRIDQLDVVNNRFRVLGQLVEIDAETHIVGGDANKPFGGLLLDTDVEISGFVNSSGVLFARYVEARRSATPLIVSGVVTDLDTTLRHMKVNGQAIDYSNATMQGFGSVPLDGATVQVSGDLVTGGGVLHATEVVYRDLRVPGQVGDDARLEGWVTRFVSATDFDVDGHPVTTTAATTTTGPWGDKVGIIQLDAFVTVKGRVIAGGVVEASEITTSNLIDINARITSITADRIEYEGRPFNNHGNCLLENVAISVDGIPADRHALHSGDTATIYELVDLATLATRCKQVIVEHNLRGPLDSVDRDTASVRVMGQRVWISPAAWVDGVNDGGRRARLLELVGSNVEVSGLTTAQGEIIASSVSRAPAATDFRITNLAGAVDTALKQLTLGNVVVDYSAADVTGFPNGQPANHDRVVVLADAPPVGGLLRAKGLRYGAGKLRGEVMNMQYLSGLITRFASPTDFDIEGRHSVAPLKPVDPGWFGHLLCDPGRMYENLPVALVAVRIPDGRLIQVATQCPRYRTSDGPDHFGWWPRQGSGSLSAIVDAVDLVHRTISIGGLTVHANPAAMVTRVGTNPDPYSGDDIPVSAAAQLGDVPVGGWVTLDLDGYGPDEGLTGNVQWDFDTVGVTDGPAQLTGPIELVEGPDLTIGGVRVHTDGTTVFHRFNTSSCSYAETGAADFFSAPREPIKASISWNGSAWIALELFDSSVDTVDSPTGC